MVPQSMVPVLLCFRSSSPIEAMHKLIYAFTKGLAGNGELDHHN